MAGVGIPLDRITSLEFQLLRQKLSKAPEIRSENLY